MSLSLYADAFNDAELAYQRGDDVTAVKYYTEACSQGHMMACNNLGNMYANANGVEQNYQLAINNYKKACDNNLMMGCNNIALLYQNGYGVKVNIRKAKYLFTKTCDNDFSGCFFLGSMYMSGELVQKDILQAEKYFIKSCKGEVGMGCWGLAMIYSHEHKDYVKSERLLKFACDLKEQGACDALKAYPFVIYTKTKLDMWNFFNKTNDGRVEAILKAVTETL